jgi:hypothetical protein
MLQINFAGPYGWPNFEKETGLPPIPQKICGVYLQTIPFKDREMIYLAGHSKNIFTRFKTHENNRRIGQDLNIFDIDLLKQGIRKRVWNGFSDWWKETPSEIGLSERADALGYCPEWGSQFPNTQIRKLVAFAENWQKVLADSERQAQSLRIYVAEFSMDDRFRKRLEASIMDSLYEAEAPFSVIPDQGMALSRRSKSRGEKPVEVSIVGHDRFHALPESLII